MKQEQDVYSALQEAAERALFELDRLRLKAGALSQENLRLKEQLTLCQWHGPNTGEITGCCKHRWEHEHT